MRRACRTVTEQGCGRGRQISIQAVTSAAVLVHVLALVAISLPEGIPLFLKVPIIIFDILLIPGFLALVAARGGINLDARSIAYSYGLSLLLLLANGVILNLLLPQFGILRPMTTVPLAAGVTGIIFGLAGFVVYKRSDEVIRIQRPPVSPAPLAILLLPLWSIISVWILGKFNNNFPIVFVLIILSFTPLVIAAMVDRRWHVLGIWSISIAVIYHKALSLMYDFSGSPDMIFNYRLNRWSPGFSANTAVGSELLPNGVLYPSIAHLTGLDILMQTEVIHPLLVSAIPAIIFLSYRQYVNSDLALLAGAVLAFAHPFYLQYPGGGRAATPVIFLSLFALALSDAELSVLLQRVLCVGFAVGIVVSHYGTSYIFLFALTGAAGLLILFALLDAVLDRSSSSDPLFLLSDGGRRLSFRERVAANLRKTRKLTISFVGFYAVANLAWYLYADGGEKFALLPRHAVRAVETILIGNTFTGQTANRIQRDYGTTSIFLSKRIYMLLAFLMVIGLAVVYYKRFISRDGVTFDDEHLVIATMLLGIFGMTILVPSWGGGRPMMITFTFTVVYAVVGVDTLVGVIEYGQKIITDRVSHSPDGVSSTVYLFGIILIVFFLLNSGVVAAVVTGGSGPSNVPSESKGEFSTGNMDAQTHAWLIDHTAQDAAVYGDFVARQQADWLAPNIAVRTESIRRYGGNRPGDLERLLSPGIPQGYLILHSSNLEHNQFTTERSTIPLKEARAERRSGSIVYTTGKSQVYYLVSNTDDQTDFEE